VTFPDNSVQTTAAVSGFVPGSGDLDLDGYSITDGNFSSPAGQVSAQNVTLSSGGVLTFGDNTTQTTAATGGGLPSLQVTATTIDPSKLELIPSYCIPLLYATHTDVLNGSYLTSFNYQNDTSTNPAFVFSGFSSLYEVTIYNNTSMLSGPDFTGCSMLHSAYVNQNTSMTSAPVFSGCNSLYEAQVYLNYSMVSAPDFSGLTSLTNAIIQNNTSMTSAPSFSGCSSLNSVSIDNNTSMTSAPDLRYLNYLAYVSITGNASMTSVPMFDGSGSIVTLSVNNNYVMSGYLNLTGLSYMTTANLGSNYSMTIPPVLSGCSSLNTLNVSICALGDAPNVNGLSNLVHVELQNNSIMSCQNLLDQLDANGASNGYLDISGGSNGPVDPYYSSLTDLQGKGWTIIFNSL
jgi:hypothetical protein